MAFSWKYEIDWQHNQSFADALDNISADVISAEWRLGFRQAYQSVADESTLKLTVRNDSGKYNPENGASSLAGYLLPQRRVRVIAVKDAVETVMWVGWIESIDPDWQPGGSATGKTTAKIQCVGAKQLLDAITVDLSLYTDITGDEVIAEVLQKALIPPAVAGVWLLGVSGNSELGVSTLLGSEADYSEVEIGKTIFGTFGDSRTYSGYQAIKEITEAERGRFFFNRAGKAVWWNRHHLPLITSATATVSSSGTYKPIKIDYRYGDGIANVVRVTPAPRRNQASVTLWELDDSLSIPPNSRLEFEADYHDADGQPVGGSSVNYTGQTFASGTATITVKNLGNRAKITLTNTGGTPAELTALSLTGTAVQDRNALTVEARDLTSLQAYGKREISFQLKALDNYKQAERIANFELNRRKQPRGLVRFIEFLNKGDGVSNAHHFAWTIGTRLTIDLPEIGHSSDHYIIGEEHQAEVGGVHLTRFYLEPANLNKWWILGVTGFSELGQTTVLGY